MGYIWPIFVFVFCTGLLSYCWWYIKLRMRWHKKGILDFRYDGHDPNQNPEGKTIVDSYREEREYDRKMKETK